MRIIIPVSPKHTVWSLESIMIDIYGKEATENLKKLGAKIEKAGLGHTYTLVTDERFDYIIKKNYPEMLI